jgi:hypothetical protein
LFLVLMAMDLVLKIVVGDLVRQRRCQPCENMKNKNCILALVAIALAIFSIHGAEAGTGTIIVYRPWSLTGSTVGFPFSLDDGPAMKIKNGYYFRLNVSAGRKLKPSPLKRIRQNSGC